MEEKAAISDLSWPNGWLAAEFCRIEFLRPKTALAE
jgi:hypothetical protein